MPLYRISRYLLSPTWPWTWSRVLAKSMGNVPGTEKRRQCLSCFLFFLQDRNSQQREPIAAWPPPESALITHRIPPSRKRARRRQKASSWGWTCPPPVQHRVTVKTYPSRGESRPKGGSLKRLKAQLLFTSNPVELRVRSLPAALVPEAPPTQYFTGSSHARPTPCCLATESKRATRQTFYLDFNFHLISLEIWVQVSHRCRKIQGGS